MEEKDLRYYGYGKQGYLYEYYKYYCRNTDKFSCVLFIDVRKYGKLRVNKLEELRMGDAVL